MSVTEQPQTQPDMTPPTPGWHHARSAAIRLVSGYGYVILGMAATVIIGTLLSPYFLTSNNLRNILLTASIVSVLAVGQFLVIVTRGIDLSVGAVAAMSTVIAAALLREGMPWGLVAIIALASCTVVGLANGLSWVYAGITPFIATLGMLSIVQGLAYIIQGPALIMITNQDFLNFFNGKVLGVQNQVIFFIAVTLLFAFIMRFTTFGRQLYAIGGNPEAARLSGLPVRRNLLAAYSLSGLLAGLAGLMLAAQLTQGSSILGAGYELDAIAAAVVGGASLYGGTGNPITAVLGGLLIGIISNIMNLRNIAAQPQLIIQGALILIAVYLTSGGASRLGRYVRTQIARRRRSTPPTPPSEDDSSIAARQPTA